MTVHSTVDVPTGGDLYVDGDWGGDEQGSPSMPYATIAAAIAAAAAGDVIHIREGAYTEDLAFAAGEDYSLVADIGQVVITGSMTVTDATVTLQGVTLIDDGAGTALHFTGTQADTLTMIGCTVSATATGAHPFEMDNTAGTVSIVECHLDADAANANEVMRVESGTLDMRRSDVLHASNVAEALVSEGDAATTIFCEDCRFQGSVNAEAAAIAAAAFDLHHCDITVGAISALIIAATCTIQYDGGQITSADAANDAADGAGNLDIGAMPVFASTADEFAATLTVTRQLTYDEQTGTVAAAGASPQTDTVTLPQPYPDANYTVLLTFEATGGGADDVICSVDEGTIAVGGFDVVTTSAAAAAISGNVHWVAKRSA